MRGERVTHERVDGVAGDEVIIVSRVERRATSERLEGLAQQLGRYVRHCGGRGTSGKRIGTGGERACAGGGKSDNRVCREVGNVLEG